MKKILLMLFALITTGAWAQTDVTSQYLTNADFSSTDGWTQNHSEQFWSLGNGLIGTYAVANDKKSTTDDTHLATEYCLGIQCRWSTNYANFTQTTQTLPVGVYTLTFDVQNVNASTSATYNNLFSVQVGETTLTDSKKEWMSGKSNWTTHTITFEITEATTATISLGYGTGSNNFGSGSTPHLYVSHLTLSWTDPLQAAKEALQAEIDKAKLCDAKEGLADAIAAAENALASATTNTELQDALAALQAADKDAVLRYENGLADAAATNGMLTSFVVNGTFDSNVNGWSRTGGFQNNGTASNQQGDFTVPFYENWNGSAKVNKMYQTINNIPNGTYKLKIAAFVNILADPNESQYVFANEDKTYLTTGDPTFYEVWTVVTNNTVEIGLEQTTATANWMGIDNVSLTYYGAGDVIAQAQAGAHKTDWDEAKAAAEAAVADEAYANVTGEELAALNAEIAKAEPTTAEAYDEATAALRAATNAFTAAKASYDAFYAIANSDYVTTLDYGTEEKRQALDEACSVEPTSAADAVEKTNAVYTALRTYYESHAMAENVEGALNMTDRIANPNAEDGNNGWTWTGSKNNPASNEPWTNADGNSTHKYFDGGNWNGSSWTTTMKQTITVPAGKYLLTAKGRAATNTTLTMAVGEASVNLPNVGSTGNVFDRGWGDASVEFETDGSDVEILVTATAEPTHEWFSIGDFRLVRLELFTEMANEEDYAALIAAIEAAEANTLGFDEGEYAPYNNVEAIKAIATAKTIDTNAENEKAEVQALTETLTNGWTANTAEVDAIFDGQFATTAANTTTGDINLPGWTKVQGIRLLVKDEATDPGLGYTDGKAAVFSWGGTTLTYGEQVGYTLPLNKGELYEFTLKVSGWRDGDMPNVVTISLDGTSQTVNAQELGAKAINVSEGNPFATLKFYVTPTEDSSKLTIYANHHFTIADLSMKLAVAEELSLSDATTFEQTEEKYANVTISRSIKEGLNTVVLPFALDATQVATMFGEGAEVYAYSESSEDANNATVNFNKKEEATIEANVPVLVKATAASTSQTVEGVIVKTAEAKVAGTNFDFVGVYAPMTVAEGDYFVSGGKLYKSTGATNLKGFRAYIKNKVGGEVKICIDGVATSIDEIVNGQSSMVNGNIYNLAGQRVSKATKGIFIKNGKKVVVK